MNAPAMLRAALCALALLFAVPSATAREMTEADTTQLGTVIERFESALREGRMEETLAVIPPRMFDRIAEKAGVDATVLREGMAAQMKAMTQNVVFEEFGMDPGAATGGEMASGEPYLVVPTFSVIKVEGVGTVTTRNHTLAFPEDGTWYLVRIDEQAQIDVLRDVYPEFVDVDFPESETSVEPE